MAGVGNHVVLKVGGGDSSRRTPPRRLWGEGLEFFLFLQPGDDLLHLADQLVEALQRLDVRRGPGHVHAGLFQYVQRVVAASRLQDLEVAGLRLLVALATLSLRAREAMMPVLYWNT